MTKEGSTSTHVSVGRFCVHLQDTQYRLAHRWQVEFLAGAVVGGGTDFRVDHRVNGCISGRVSEYRWVHNRNVASSVNCQLTITSINRSQSNESIAGFKSRSSPVYFARGIRFPSQALPWQPGQWSFPGRFVCSGAVGCITFLVC